MVVRQGIVVLVAFTPFRAEAKRGENPRSSDIQNFFRFPFHIPRLISAFLPLSFRFHGFWRLIPLFFLFEFSLLSIPCAPAVP